MRWIRLVVLATAVLVFAGCQPGGEAPQAVQEVKEYTIQQFLATTALGGGIFSHDNRSLLVHSDASGVFNAYAYPTDGGEPTQLTFSEDDAIFVFDYFPTDDRFLYTSDQGGNELNHVFVCEPRDEGPCGARDLTPGEDLKALFYGFSFDGESFYVGTNERDAKYFDVYEYRSAGYERERIFTNDEAYVFSAASPDGRYLALAKIESNADSDVYLYDREGGETRHLTPHEGEVNHFAETFSTDGQSLYLVTDADGEYYYLVRQDLANGEREVVVQTGWDIAYATLSHSGTYLVVGINNDARTELRVHETATMERVELPQLPDADVKAVKISQDERHMSFWASSARMPSDLFVHDLGSDAAPRRLTDSLSPEITAEDLVEGEVVRFASFDGLEIPGILYRPHTASAEDKAPALVWVHGGPGGQSRVGYSSLIQYLVNHGYVVYAINNRGSSGYGKTFYHLDDHQHGKGDLDDCVASKQMLVDLGYADPARIGIVGGSYGGFMVLAALTFRPDAFEVGVDVFGVSNWARTLQSIPPWWEAGRKHLEKEFGDFDDEEYLRSISPLFHAENIEKPLIVLQGANDARVLKIESDEIVEAARQNGVPVEYVVFEDEGHGFRKKENRARGYEAILKFLDEHLKNQPSVKSPKTVG